MARRERELLRPEDATSWEEFRNRCVIEQAQCRALNSSNRAIIQALLSALFGFGAILFWGALAFTPGWAKLIPIIPALLFTWLFVRFFMKGMRRGVRGTKRYRELGRLSKEWRARADRGEIPLTTPGGITVWRDELDGHPV
jgi:hypothetical protein